MKVETADSVRPFENHPRIHSRMTGRLHKGMTFGWFYDYICKFNLVCAIATNFIQAWVQSFLHNSKKGIFCGNECFFYKEVFT